MSNEKRFFEKEQEGALKLLDHSNTEGKFYLMKDYENSNVSMTNFIFAMASVYWSRNVANAQNLTWPFHTCVWHTVKPNQELIQQHIFFTKHNIHNTHATFINILWEFFVHLSIVVLVVVVVLVWNSFFLCSCFASLLFRFNIYIVFCLVPTKIALLSLLSVSQRFSFDFSSIRLLPLTWLCSIRASPKYSKF